jgi:ATP synthase protein I
MRLRIVTPLSVVVDEDADSLRAEDASGSFGIRPGHAPFLTALAVSIVSWKTAGLERFCALRGGVLTVTGGSTVAIATREAVARRRSGNAGRAGSGSVPVRSRRGTGRACRDDAPAIARHSPDDQPVAARLWHGNLPMTEDPTVRNETDPLVEEIRKHRARRDRWLREGDMSVGRRLAQIGVLGWIFVVPTLAGLFFGRWLDAQFGTGIFWSAPMMLLGLCIGGWTAWKWMNAR